MIKPAPVGTYLTGNKSCSIISVEVINRGQLRISRHFKGISLSGARDGDRTLCCFQDPSRTDDRSHTIGWDGTEVQHPFLLIQKKDVY